LIVGSLVGRAVGRSLARSGGRSVGHVGMPRKYPGFPVDATGVLDLSEGADMRRMCAGVAVPSVTGRTGVGRCNTQHAVAPAVLQSQLTSDEHPPGPPNRTRLKPRTTSEWTPVLLAMRQQHYTGWSAAGGSRWDIPRFGVASTNGSCLDVFYIYLNLGIDPLAPPGGRGLF
jgi:hypothetical protein